MRKPSTEWLVEGRCWKECLAEITVLAEDVQVAPRQKDSWDIEETVKLVGFKH